MMKTLGGFTTAVVVALLAVQATGLTQAPAAPKVQVRGLRIVAEGYGPTKEESRAFNWTKGVTIGLLVTLSDGVIMNVDSEKSEVTQLGDNTGTDLLAGDEANPWDCPPVGSFPDVSEDGKAVMVEIQSRNLPAPGATQLHATGFFMAKCAARKEIVRVENIPLKQGSRFTAGKSEFEIAEVGPVQPNWRARWPQYTVNGIPDPPADALQVSVHSRGACPDFVAMSLAGSGEQDVGSQLILKGSPIDGSVGITYILSKKVDSIDIDVTYCMDIKEVKIPFDVKATMALE